MPKYAYRALSSDGTHVRGSTTAGSANLAHASLVDRGLRPVELAPKKSVLQFEITKRKVPRKDIQQFSRQLAVFVRAGIPLLDALEVIAEEAGNKLFKSALADIAEQLRSGATFAAAAAAHPEAFPPLYLSILRSAELTGNLDNVLDQLSEYLHRDLEARRKISSALVYPAVVAVMSVITIIVLTTFVLPRFEHFFESLNAKLPLATRLLLSVSHFLSHWAWLLGVVTLAVTLVIGFGLRTRRGKDARDRVLLRLPVVGGLVRHAVLERFCRVLSSLILAGVPLPDALAVTSDATNNAVYRRGIETARDAMLRGEGLAGPLSRTGLFPAAARQIFTVGENTGTLDAQLAVAAEYFEQELDHRLDRFTSLFEPAVIIVMGGIVGFAAIALISAMYGIFNQVKI